MNFVLYAIQRKKTNKVIAQGLMFVQDKDIDPQFSKGQDKKNKEAYLDSLGFDPKHYKISFAKFKTLRKLRKALYHAYFG